MSKSAFSKRVVETQNCAVRKGVGHFEHKFQGEKGVVHVGAELQATNRVPRWRIGELPPDMEVSCKISKCCT